MVMSSLRLTALSLDLMDMHHWLRRIGRKKEQVSRFLAVSLQIDFSNLGGIVGYRNT